MTNIYWDSVLVKDNALPSDLFYKLKKDALEKRDMQLGVVTGGDPEKTQYLYAENDRFKYLDDWIESTNIIPRLPNHRQSWAIRHHFMEKGGKMIWHKDAKYSIAVTIYLSSCEGGELHVMSHCGTQGVILSPVENRAVVIKCDQDHCVLPVISGDRHSIQIFIIYSKD